jgi:hypothetical protein
MYILCMTVGSFLAHLKIYKFTRAGCRHKSINHIEHDLMFKLYTRMLYNSGPIYLSHTSYFAILLLSLTTAVIIAPRSYHNSQNGILASTSIVSLKLLEWTTLSLLPKNVVGRKGGKRVVGVIGRTVGSQGHQVQQKAS